jgi:gluconolactonase
VKSDGSIWFSDPQFGILGYYEGHVDTPELPMNVYRVDGLTGAMSVVADGINAPNGLCFSPDEGRLYIVESRAEPRNIRAFDVVDGVRLTGGDILIDSGPLGTPDGIRCDVEGNLWCGWGMSAELDGVMVFSPAGEPLGHIALPERCANLCFGGRWRNRLFMAASHSVYSLYVNTQGAV